VTPERAAGYNTLMATVYLDSSFISACVTDRTDARSEVR
jgi:hypothetical protein